MILTRLQMFTLIEIHEIGEYKYKYPFHEFYVYDIWVNA